MKAIQCKNTPQNMSGLQDFSTFFAGLAGFADRPVHPEAVIHS